MTQTDQKTYLFEKAPVHKAFLTLALPSLFSMIIMLLYNLADTYFIAYTNDPQIVAGVSLASPVFMIMIALGDIFGVGGSSIVSRLMGRQLQQDTRRISTLCFYGALALGAVYGLLLLIFREPILALLGASGSTYRHAWEYYTYLAIGAPFIIASIVPLNLLRTEGASKASMLGSVTGSVVNIILDPIFIMGLGMGAAGAAIATVIGNVASVLVFSLFYRKTEWISIRPRYLKPNLADLKGITAIGIPAALNNLLSSFAMALTNRFLIPHGSDVLAAWSIAGKCTLVCTMLLVSFSFSSLPLIGYSFGRKDLGRLKQILKFMYSFLACVAIISSLAMILAAPGFIRVFIDGGNILTLGIQILRCQVLGTVFNAMILISTCVFQATGNARGTLLSTLSRQGIVFVPVLSLFSALWGYWGILLAQPAADLITAAIVLALVRKTTRSLFSSTEN